MHWLEVPSIPLPRPWLEFSLLATVDNSNNPSHHWMSLLTFPDRGPMEMLERNCQLQPNAEQVSSSFAQVSCLKSPTLTLFIRPQKSWHVQIIFGRPNVSPRSLLQKASWHYLRLPTKTLITFDFQWNLVTATVWLPWFCPQNSSEVAHFFTNWNTNWRPTSGQRRIQKLQCRIRKFLHLRMRM